MLYCFS